MSLRIRSYSELITFPTFEERFRYLSLRGRVGKQTFGFERFLNQAFYSSREWKDVRDVVISRDLGCDLGVPGYEIHDRVIIHHINPMTIQEIEDRDPDILDPENLIVTSHRTHNAVHYGDESQLPMPVIERKAGDTKLW